MIADAVREALSLLSTAEADRTAGRTAVDQAYGSMSAAPLQTLNSLMLRFQEIAIDLVREGGLAPQTPNLSAREISDRLNMARRRDPSNGIAVPEGLRLDWDSSRIGYFDYVVPWGQLEAEEERRRDVPPSGSDGEAAAISRTPAEELAAILRDAHVTPPLDDGACVGCGAWMPRNHVELHDHSEDCPLPAEYAARRDWKTRIAAVIATLNSTTAP